MAFTVVENGIDSAPYLAIFEQGGSADILGSSRKYLYPYHGWPFLEFRMHGGGGSLAWNSECMRGFLVLEFQRGG